MSDSEDHVDIPDEGDDLFGDGDDGSDNERPLSDHELDEEEDERHGDDEREDEDEGPVQIKHTRVQDQVIFRHRVPKPSDGTLRTMRIPHFLRVVPEEYNQDAYEPTEIDLAEDRKKYPASAIRWRRNAETGKPESNAVIYKWSDGSATLAVGDQHYEVDVKSLAPSTKSYDARRDANYYAAAAHLSSNLLLAVGHITEEYKVKPNAALENAAVDRLMATMDAATRHRHMEDNVIFRATEDPETQRKQAELAEKERERARRRRENAAARLDAGPTSRRGGGGLSIGGLESGERAGGTRRGKGAGGGQRQKRRRPEYDSDDDLPRGARRQDDYDMGDDFIAPSDEELSNGDDDDEELLDDDDEEEERAAPRSKRQKTAESADDEDADGEDDTPAAHADQTGRRGRRHIVDDDDE